MLGLWAHLRFLPSKVSVIHGTQSANLGPKPKEADVKFAQAAGVFLRVSENIYHVSLCFLHCD